MRFLRRPSPAWVGFAVVVLVRALVAASRLDELGFQRYTGNIAWALLNGLPLEPTELPLIPHNRGSMVVGFLAVPLLALLGPTLLALKVLAVGLAGATAALFVHLLDRRVGRVAAWAGVALYALLPPAFQMVDVLPLGSHVDTILLTLAAVLVLTGVTDAREPRPLLALAWGLLCGFGLFFTMHFALVIPALAGIALVHRLRRAAHGERLRDVLRVGLPFAAGVVLAVAPSFAFLPESRDATEVIRVPLGERILPEGAAHVPVKLAAVLFVQWPATWLFDDNGGAWARLAFGLGLLPGLLLTLRRLRRAEPFLLFALVYPALLLGAMGVTNFQLKLENTASGMGGRFLMPALPFLAAWVAIGAQALAERGRRALAGASVAAPLAAGLVGTVALIDLRVPAGQPPVRGTDFAFFKRHIERAGGDDPAARLAWIERLDPDWPALRPLSYEEVALAATSWASLDAFLADVERARAAVPELRPSLLVQLGRWLSRDEALVPQLLRRTDELDREAAAWLFRGLGKGWMGGHVWTRMARGHEPAESGRAASPVARELAGLPDVARGPVAEGMGFWLGLRVTPYHLLGLTALRELVSLPPALARPLFFGMGEGYRARFVEPGYRAPTFLRIEAELPPAALEAFRAGLAATASVGGGESAHAGAGGSR